MNSRHVPRAQSQPHPKTSIVANSAGLMAQRISRENAPNTRGLANNVMHRGGTSSAMKYMRKINTPSNQGDRYISKDLRKSKATPTNQMLHYHEAAEHLNKRSRNHIKSYKTLYY